MGLIRKTLSVNFTLGTYGYRNKQEKFEHRMKLAARKTHVLLAEQNGLIAEQTALIESQTMPVVKAPVQSKATKALAPSIAIAQQRPAPVKIPTVKKPTKVDRATVDRAERVVVSTQSASRFGLISALDINGDQCNYIMKKLEKRGVITKENEYHGRDVILREQRGSK
ncbi:hypothetical protein [Arthrobacter sp. AQ5-05]|uniref:hypothetical protein n=1 Tax=Arthrobacter sp. AQ5-05 TaxID=2184581 RepID=UPI0012B5BCFA|nr:hypothetical protein [Arthrobacter sp. AQ5-05]